MFTCFFFSVTFSILRINFFFVSSPFSQLRHLRHEAISLKICLMCFFKPTFIHSFIHSLIHTFCTSDVASIISISFFHNIVYYPFPVSLYIKKKKWYKQRNRHGRTCRITVQHLKNCVFLKYRVRRCCHLLIKRKQYPLLVPLYLYEGQGFLSFQQECTEGLWRVFECY